MLSLEPPYRQIEGVLVFRDHAIAHQFYYAAPEPRIARIGGRLAFDLFAYTRRLEHSPLAGTRIPDELGAGFLNLGVDCALPAAVARTMTRTLAALEQVPEDRLTLIPIPYAEGSVRVLALDRYSEPDRPPADPTSSQAASGRPTFVEAILGEQRPSLLGDLRTIFSLQLSQDGVAFLDGLYRDGAAPVGIVYELTFYGMLPAIEFTARADLSRVYQHFGGGLDLQVKWVRAEIDAAIESLEERSVVEIDVISHRADATATQSKELALSLFKERLVQELFRPIAPTASQPASGGSGAADLASAVTGAAAGGSVGLTLRMLRREELKTVTYRFHERSPDKRVHAPQGFLPVLLSPAELERHVHHVDLDHAFFSLLDVLVTGPTATEFDALGIREVVVDVAYGEAGDEAEPESETVAFRRDDTGDKRVAFKRRGRPSLAYRYTVRYAFLRTGRTDADAFAYDLDARSSTSRTLLVNPYRDFGVLDVEVVAGRLHPTMSEVDVHLAYEDEANGFSASDTMRLRPGADQGPPRHWQVRTRGAARAAYTAAFVFVFEDGSTYRAPPRPFEEPLLRVDTPFEAERTLLITPNVLSDDVTRITVQVRYRDDASGYARDFLVELLPEGADGQRRWPSRTLAWPILSADRATVGYRTIVHEPGFSDEGEWRTTTDPSLVVGVVNRRVRRVEVRLVGPPLGEVGLDALLVKLRPAEDGVAGEETSLFFEPGQNVQHTEFTLAPGAELRYEVQTTAFKRDGNVVTSAWTPSTSDLLPIPTRTLG